LQQAALLTLNKVGIQKTLEELQIDTEISILFTNNDEIQLLNAQYRYKNCPTDVLSFPMQDDVNAFIQDNDFQEGQYLLLGDIIISLEKAQEQSEKYGHSMEREVLFLFVHGLLHLLGYDHIKEQDEQAMRALQTAILADLGQLR
jgi:probable rRNA maturation factor